MGDINNKSIPLTTNKVSSRKKKNSNNKSKPSGDQTNSLCGIIYNNCNSSLPLENNLVLEVEVRKSFLNYTLRFSSNFRWRQTLPMN